MLEGDLGDFSLPDILQLLAFTTKSGRLRIGQGAATGRVDLDAGRIRDASSDAVRLPLARRLLGGGVVDGETVRGMLEPAGRLPTDLEFAAALAAAGRVDADALADLVREQVVDAVFDLLRWQEGSFRFDADVTLELPTETSLPDGWTVEELLADAQQRLEDWPAILERTGPGEAIVSIARPTDEAAKVPPDGWALLAMIDGRRNVADLVILSGRGEFRVRRLLGELLDAGVVALDAGGTAPVDRLVAVHEALAAREAELAGAPAEVGKEPAPVPEAAAEKAGEPEAAEPVPAAAEPESAATAESAEEEVAEASADAEPATDGQEDEATAAEASDEGGEEPSAADEGADLPGEVTPLRTGGRRSDRLRTDPSVDADLIERLIDGVENL